MTRVSRQLLDSWLRGELDEAESAAVEYATLVDPATSALLGQLLSEEAANAPAEAKDPFRSPEVDPDGPAALAIRGALRQIAASRRRSRMIRVTSIAATGLLALGLWSFLEPDPQLPRNPIDRVCDVARTGSPLPLHTSVDCGIPPDVHLGTSPGTEVTSLRWELDADPRPDDPAWLKARGLVDLLEGRSGDVIARLESSPMLQSHPLLYADLATAWLIQGNREEARQALQVGLSIAPDDPTLRRDLVLLSK